MLVGLGMALDGADMHPAFVGKSGIADVCLMLGRGKVCQFVDIA